MKRVGLQSLVLRKEIRKEIWGTLIFCVWACFKHKLKFNWAHSPKSLILSPGKRERAGSGRKLPEPCWLVVISWWSAGQVWCVCFCSKSWPGAHGKEDSAKSSGSQITWPPVKYHFLCCIVWFSYLFSGWESCYNSCLFSRPLTEFFWCVLNSCTKTQCPAWCLVVQRCTARPEGNISESLQALLFWSCLDT